MSNAIRVVMLASFVSSALAQFDSGQIAGFVRDPSQSVIAGASITVTNEGNGEKHRTITNSSGYYVVPNLFVGSYSVEVEATGFKKSVQSGIQLSAAAKLSIDIELTVGSVTDSVEVNATATLVQSETATVGRTVDTKQIENLTTNGRNPIYLALLKPGVIGGSIGTFDPDSVSNGGFSINGARADEYVVMVDGAVATRTRSSGSMLGAQDVDTVQEVQILTANFNAEYGRSSGGQIRFVTKSGTTAFHGDLVENFRNSALDANSWTRNHATDPSLSTRPQPFRFNQFGFDVSGPIFMPRQVQRGQEQAVLPLCRRMDAAPRRQHQHLHGADPAMRNGDLSSLLSPSNPFFGRARVATDPDTKQPFPGNIIPANRISPNGRALLNAYPLPTPGFQQGTSNWIGAYSHYSDLRKDTMKFDYLVNDKHRISLRGTHIPWQFNSPFEGTLFSRALVAAEPNRRTQPGQQLFADLYQRVHFLGQLRRIGLDLCRSVLRSTLQPQRGRHHVSVHLSRHEVVRRQAAVDRRRRADHDRQRPISRDLVRIRLRLGQQHDQGHQQPHHQVRRLHRTLRPERPHPIHYRQRARHDQRERLVPFPRHAAIR